MTHGHAGCRKNAKISVSPAPPAFRGKMTQILTLSPHGTEPDCTRHSTRNSALRHTEKCANAQVVTDKHSRLSLSVLQVRQGFWKFRIILFLPFSNAFFHSFSQNESGITALADTRFFAAMVAQALCLYGFTLKTIQP